MNFVKLHKISDVFIRGNTRLGVLDVMTLKMKFCLLVADDEKGGLYGVIC